MQLHRPSYLKFRIWKETWDMFFENRCMRLAAALAYSSIFAFAPILIITLSIASFFFSDQAARGEVQSYLEDFWGQDVAKVLESMIEARRVNQGLSALIGAVILVLASSGLIALIKDCLNTIWGLKEKPRNPVKNFLLNRAKGFIAVLCMGLLLVGYLVASFFVNDLSSHLSGIFNMPAWLLSAISQLPVLMLLVIAFGLVMRYLPDSALHWRDVAPGALVTSVLFALGQFIFRLYLQHRGITSAFGAAGSVVVILIWVYYSSVIFLFGAEFTQARLHSKNWFVPPGKTAFKMPDSERIKQGMPSRQQIEAWERHHQRGKA